MLSQSEERLLRWLGRFPSALNEAWDVPRGVSLPGLAEAMGVVRSALHNPLNQLVEKGLALTKIAHVIGGGSRRRSIYLLSEKGREFLKKLPSSVDEEATSAARKGVISGSPPEGIKLLGREEEIQKIITTLNGSGCAIITGLPGIGKTSLLKQVCDELTELGRDIAWARATSFDDFSTLLGGAFDDAEAPSSPDAACEWLIRRIGRGVIIIDELQEIHSRHINTVVSALKKIIESKADIIIASRAPAPIDNEDCTITIGEISQKAALELLGEELEEKRKEEIVSALGGHPLALKLYEIDDDLPEVGANIQAYVEENVIANLPPEVLPGLDELAAMPIPIPVERLANEGVVGVLDDHALLRWVGEDDSAVELQHLIGNVRRASWDEETATAVHSAAARHWAEQPDSHSRIIEFHHRLNSNDTTLDKYVEEYSDTLATIDDGALSVLLHDAIERQPEVKGFWLLAARCALDRGEKEEATKIISKMPDSDDDPEALHLSARLELQKGNVTQAEKLMESAQSFATPAQSIRIIISRLSKLLDDRLPNESPAKDLREIADESKGIEVSDLDPDTRQKALVAIAFLRHSISVLEEDYNLANEIRNQMQSLTGGEDPLIEELALRAALNQAEFDSQDWHRNSEILRKKITQTTNLRSLALRLFLVGKIADEDRSSAMELLNEADLDLDMQFSPTSRRLIALVWYWRGVFDETRTLEYWREAIHRFRTAECPHAAQQLTQKMHSRLR